MKIRDIRPEHLCLVGTETVVTGDAKMFHDGAYHPTSTPTRDGDGIIWAPKGALRPKDEPPENHTGENEVLNLFKEKENA